jgi:hypothetical protein
VHAYALFWALVHSCGRITVIINWRKSGTGEANKHPARPVWSPKVHYHLLNTVLTKFIQPDMCLPLGHYQFPGHIILNNYYQSDHINDMGQACNVHGTNMKFIHFSWEVDERILQWISLKYIFHTFLYYQIQY